MSLSTSTLPFKTFALTTPSDQPPSASSTSLTLHPIPSHPTDIWRKPATHSPSVPQVTSFNAPIIYKALPFARFSRTRVTITARWERLYDQGGLVLVFPKAGEEEIGTRNRWIKTGIEYYQGEAMVSTVSCDLFADWSLSPLPSSSASTSLETSVTLEMEWKDTGSALWIYVIDGEKRIPIREVTWVLSGEIDKDADVWVGVYAATPIMEGGRAEGEALEVKFEKFELVIKE